MEDWNNEIDEDAGDIKVQGRFTRKALKALLQLNYKEKLIPSKDILLAIKSQDGVGTKLINAFDLTSQPFPEKIDPAELVKSAFYDALIRHHPYVGTEHLLLALLLLNKKLGLHVSVSKKLTEMLTISLNILPLGEEIPENLFDPMPSLNEKISRDSRKNYIERNPYQLIVSTFFQEENPNPLLVGDPGVGKRSLVSLLAKNINEMNVPATLINAQILEVDLLSLVTGSLNKINIEQFLGSFLAQTDKTAKTIIYIKNFENLFFATGSGLAVPLVYNSFRAQLANSNIRYIATCSSDMYNKLLADNPQSLEGFSVIEVEEPNEDEMEEILYANPVVYGERKRVLFPNSVLNYIYTRSKDIPSEEKYPKKAILLMNQVAARIMLKNDKIPPDYKRLLELSEFLEDEAIKFLGERNYDEAFLAKKGAAKTKEKLSQEEVKMLREEDFPVKISDVDETLEHYGIGKKSSIGKDLASVTGLEERLKGRIIGQPEAITLVSKALIRAKLGLRSKKRPLGNFLFLGPTGVGKTELAKALALEFFGEGKLIRLDMSDFGEKHTVARLVGAPPGYVGYGEAGELTGKIEKNPSSVVLFDEIEKAHPDVLNILLQIMEEGELVDAKGTTYDFSSSVVVLTSNLGTEIVHKPGMGFEAKIIDDKSLEARLRSNLKKILKPELLNRLDEIVVFKRLTKEDQYKILDLLIEEVRVNLAEQRISLKMLKGVKDFLLEKGYSEEYGARALRRTVEKELLDKIAEYLLQNKKRPLRLSASLKEGSILIS